MQRIRLLPGMMPVRSYGINPFRGGKTIPGMTAGHAGVRIRYMYFSGFPVCVLYDTDGEGSYSSSSLAVITSCVSKRTTFSSSSSYFSFMGFPPFAKARAKSVSIMPRSGEIASP